jgi:hypothetical protein
MFTWRTYIPFEPGRELEVRARRFFATVTGGARCEELSDNRLRLTVHIPQTTIFGQTIPETNVDILCVYNGAQTDNYASISLNGELLEDSKVVIQAFPSANRIRIDPSVDGEGGADIAFSLRRKDDDIEINDISGFSKLDGVSIRVRG